jgi:hypothetical protein
MPLKPKKNAILGKKRINKELPMPMVLVQKRQLPKIAAT